MVDDLQWAREYGGVMVDPSLLLSPRGVRLIAELPPAERRRLFVPGFFDLCLEEEEQPLRRYFRSRRPLSAGQIRQATEGLRRTEPFFEPMWSEYFRGDQVEVALNLARLAPTPLLGHLLREEWLFLMTRSLILARLRRTFDAFVRAGAAALEWGARRTLHLDPSLPLTRAQWGRAGAKWVAVAGDALVGLLGPVGTVPTLGLSLFLLLDP